jgi:hypothetical protein
LESTQRQKVEASEWYIAELALADVPNHHAIALVAGGSLGKLTGTGDVAFADIEPVAGEMPLGNIIHARFLLTVEPSTSSSATLGRASVPVSLASRHE